MSQPLQVSFVVLNYNNGVYLVDCIDSILAQLGDYDFEIVVVDDASTDQSLAIVQGYTDARLHLIRHTANQGHLVTVQDGLRAARGQYIARIDSDDRYRADFLQVTIPILEKYPEVGLVYGDAAIIDQQGHCTAEHSDLAHANQDHKGNEFVRLLEVNFICAPTVIARREAWMQTLPLPEGLAFHDWYFTIMMARVWEFYYIDRVLADYRVHVSNMHTQIARDGSEEVSIVRLLTQVYGESETTTDLQFQKEKARSQVFGVHYLRFANNYFWFGLNGEARRCYFKAISYRPLFVFRTTVVRRVLATLLSRAAYEWLKQMFVLRFISKPETQPQLDV